LTDFGQRHRLSAKLLSDMSLTLDEIVANIMSHGFEDTKEHRIKVGLYVERGELRAEIEDDGKPFNPLEMPPPDTGQALEKRSVGGLGVYLVRTLMDEVTYQRRENMNILVARTRISES
jgi:serine/threonine-protein kinase RsbW